jgi:hypothetical protein
MERPGNSARYAARIAGFVEIVGPEGSRIAMGARNGRPRLPGYPSKGDAREPLLPRGER